MSDSTPTAGGQQADAAGFRTGFVAIVGRPNVGKSTLLNRLIGQKISIVSSKAQTTRHRVTGIRTDAGAQFVFVDTPGFQTHHRNALNRSMNRTVTQVLSDVDLVFFLVEAGRFGEDDRKVVEVLPEGARVVLVINKVDRLDDKRSLLPFIEQMSAVYPFAEIVPLSAERGTNVDALIRAATPLLPEGTAMYDEDEITDRSERFLAGELVREQLMLRLGEELPYSTTVEIEKFEEDGELLRIAAVIWVEREGQKPIVIGKGGERMKAISTGARIGMEKLFGRKVFLETWCRVREGWSDDEAALRRFGYSD